MTSKLKYLFIYFLCTILVLNVFTTTVFASEGGGHDIDDSGSGGKGDETERPGQDTEDSALERTLESMATVGSYILAQTGCIVNRDSLSDYIENNDTFKSKLEEIWKKENIYLKKDTNGKQSLVFSKVVADTLLKGLKDATKDTDNGGYELVKTVPVNKVSSLYFNTLAEYRTMYELLKDNNGILGVYYYSVGSTGIRAEFCKVISDGVWIRGSSKKYTDSDGICHECYSVHSQKNLNVPMSTYYSFYLKDKNTTVSKWEDTGLGGYQAYEGLWGSSTSSTVGSFFMNDLFSLRVNNGSGTNPLKNDYFLVTTTGSTIPVFNSIDDAIAYSVANNLYYTTSDFTGEGQEVTIDYDELDKILSGYYSGMYDMLQRLIEQNGGNALTPEQVQELADRVAESFDMLKTEINKGFEEQDKLIEANSNILKAVKSVMEKGFENIEKLLEDILGKLENLKIDTGGTGGGLIVGGIDLLLDLAEFVKGFVADTESGVATLASGFTDVVGVMSKKFPFCIPWDICTLIARFAYAPEAPVFEIPLKLSRYGIDEKFVIDFSDFEVISKISRSLLSILYAVGLVKFTDRVIGVKKGGGVL